MRVLIVGATGNIGRVLLERLLALPNPPTIRVSSRDPSKANFPSSVEAVQGDVSDSSSWPRMFDCVDRVFIYPIYGQNSPELMKAMKAGGVSYVVLISAKWVSTEPNHPFAQLTSPWEESVKTSGFSYTFIRPSGFSSNFTLHWRPEVQATGSLAFPYPESQSAPVAAEDMADVALIALTTDQLVNATPVLTGPVSLTQTQQVEALNRVRTAAGLPLIRLRQVSPEEWKASAVSRMPGFICDALLMTWKASVGHPEDIEDSERITGKPATSYDAWVDLHKAEVCQ